MDFTFATNQRKMYCLRLIRALGKIDAIAATKPLTLLLMGVDTGSGSRSDRCLVSADSLGDGQLKTKRLR